METEPCQCALVISGGMEASLSLSPLLYIGSFTLSLLKPGPKQAESGNRGQENVSNNVLEGEIQSMGQEEQQGPQGHPLCPLQGQVECRGTDTPGSTRDPISWGEGPDSLRLAPLSPDSDTSPRHPQT